MSADSRPRIVVWLDPTAPQQAALQALAGLGAATEILGLFVEDADLLDVSRLSVAREITWDEQTARKMDERRTEQQFRVHGARMRSLFEATARKITTRHSFRVARGVLRNELLKISADYDTLVLTHSRRHFGPRLTIRAQLDDLLSRGPGTLVFVQERWLVGERIVVLFDGSPESDIALRAGAAMAASAHLALAVWVPEEHRDELEQQAAQALDEPKRCTFRTVAADDVEALGRLADADDARVLVLPGTDAARTRERVAGLLDRASCSVIVVR
ncbi:MAG: hypothetical protein ACE5G3_05440 [Gammaproteobacteria bacterium]